MSAGIEFHDSYIVQIGENTILLDAYVHQPNRPEETESHDTGMQLIRMTFTNMRIEGEIGELPIDIYDDELRIGNRVVNDLIPFPVMFEDIVSFKVYGRDGRVIEIFGDSISFQPEGEFQFNQKFYRAKQ